MKTIVTTLNAKYIHNSLALRLLYVVNRNKFDISFQEHTIKEDIETIANDLLMQNPDCIGIGVYIWNVEHIKKLVKKIRKIKPSITLILGGPEVSYEPSYFLENLDIDYVISGEGEFVLGELLYALENKLPTNINAVSSKENISNIVAQASIEELIKYPSPYKLEEDINSIPNKIMYFETSRGCPYSCSYCLSSLEKGVRYFPQDYIFDNLLYLINNNAKQIKFLDRTFNLNKQNTYKIFQFLVDNYKENLSCQFEVYADILDEKIIEWLNTNLPLNYFRFEIGIQSTHNPSNEAINRTQDFVALSRNIKLLQAGKIDLHLDLIAGLPFETFEIFVKSFNDVFAFKAKELQLGFLKLLRGTALKNQAQKYGYIYQQNAPYQVISNNCISNEELERIHLVEHILEKYWNSGRFKKTMEELFQNYYNNYFHFFEEFGNYCVDEDYKLQKYQLEDLYKYIHSFFKFKRIELFEYLREDYYNNFTVRPTLFFWEDLIDKKERKKLLDLISKNRKFLEKEGLTAYQIKKQAIIDKYSQESYLLTIFVNQTRVKKIIEQNTIL